MNRYRLLPLLLIAGCLSWPASAQVNPFRGSRGTPLTSEDIAAMTDASNHLLGRENLVPGETEPWINPKSGAKGIVTSAATVQRNGMACRRLVYDTTMPGGASGATRSTTLIWCKTAAGWKIG
jgi:hypothetical protein